MSRDALLARLERELERVVTDHPPSSWCVALSGGADSVALLAALVQLRAAHAHWRAVPLRAVHVHHGLRPAAGAWARSCRALCEALDVPLTVRRVKVLPQRGSSLEAEARAVRYAALGKGLRRNEWLLTAHHEDDQLETLLLQLMRGAGVAGLAAMPRVGTFGPGLLVRPLLGESRSTLESWLRKQDLCWVEDDSNADERFDRNYLRHRVLPLLRTRWPAAATVAARSAAHLGEARELLEAVAAADLLEIAGATEQREPQNRQTRDLKSDTPPRRIDLARLAALSPARQRNVLRYWLTCCGLPVPDSVHLERIRSELPKARVDAQPRVGWPGGEVRRFRGHLYAFAAGELPTGDRGQPERQARLSWRWRRQRRLDLGAGRGVLRLVQDRHGEIDAARLPTVLWVGSRAGGEKLQLAQGGPRRDLKELLRVAEVPPWQRQHLPVIYTSDKATASAVVAVAALYVAAPYRAIVGTTPAASRFRLVWEAGFC